MSRISLFIAIAVLSCIVSCASPQVKKPEQQQYSSKDNWVSVYSVGIRTAETGTGFVIEGMDTDSPAIESGMRVGDLIVSINGKPVTQREMNTLTHLQQGDALRIATDRDGKRSEHSIAPKKRFKWPPSAAKIYQLLLDNQKISLAVLVAEVKSDGKGGRAAEDAQRQQWHDFINKHVLKEFGQNKNLTVVNSKLLYNTLDRHKFDMSGPISEDARTIISKMTGATHVLVASLSRLLDDQTTHVDIATARLIDLSTGAELAFDERIDCKQ